MESWYSLPLPAHIDEDRIIRTISPDKDVDGFHPVNVGRLWLGETGFVSCTPAGIIQLLKYSGIEIAGKECVVIGRSNIVGKPMAALLLRENGTVTVAHSRTADLKEVTRRADILIAAVGQTEDDHSRVHKRRRGCDRCGNAQGCPEPSLWRCGF